MGTTEGLEGLEQYAFAIVMYNDMIPVSATPEMNYTVADMATARPGGNSDAPVVLMVLLPKGAKPRTTVTAKQLFFTPPASTLITPIIASGGTPTNKSGATPTNKSGGKPTNAMLAARASSVAVVAERMEKMNAEHMACYMENGLQSLKEFCSKPQTGESPFSKGAPPGATPLLLEHHNLNLYSVWEDSDSTVKIGCIVCAHAGKNVTGAGGQVRTGTKLFTNSECGSPGIFLAGSHLNSVANFRKHVESKKHHRNLDVFLSEKSALQKMWRVQCEAVLSELRTHSKGDDCTGIRVTPGKISMRHGIECTICTTPHDGALVCTEFRLRESFLTISQSIARAGSTMRTSAQSSQ
jgi:hypothetical protein